MWLMCFPNKISLMTSMWNIVGEGKIQPIYFILFYFVNNNVNIHKMMAQNICKRPQTKEKESMHPDA